MKYWILITALLLCCKRPTEDEQSSAGSHSEPKLSSQFRYKYYRAVARSGLRLREAPNLEAKKISLIPYQTNGEIIESQPNPVTIDKRRGFWLKVKYKAETGWIFSGYALLSDSPHESSEDDYFPTEARIVKDLDPELELSEWKLRSLKSVNGFEILLGRHGDHGKNSNLGNLFFKRDNKLFSYHIGGYERIEKVGFPVANSIITTWVECTECCAEVQDWGRFYLFEADKIRTVDIQFSDQKADCGDIDDDIDSRKPEIINRWSVDTRTLYQLMRFPHCEYHDKNKFLVESKPEKKHFSTVRFAPDKILIEDFKDTDVPEKYKTLWNSKELRKIKL